MVDIHSHILPGLDDGPDGMAAVIKMAEIAQTDGIRHIIATPHIIPGIYDNTPDAIHTAVERVNNQLMLEGIETRVYFGGEHYLDDSLCGVIKKNQLCTINAQGKYVLVECPMNEFPPYVERILSQIREKGIRPILAHPERNAAMHKNSQLLYTLINQETLVQINASSIMGQFGPWSRKFAELMLRHNWVHFIASDAHSVEIRPPVVSDALNLIKTILGEEPGELISLNSYRLLMGEDIEIKPVEKLTIPKNTFYIDWPTD